MTQRAWLFAILVSAGCPTASPPTAQPRPGGAPQAPEIDGERLFANLQHLASDSLAGRYSLEHGSIEAAARYIADRHREAGLLPVGSDYLVPFGLPSGSETGDRHHLWIERDGKETEVTAFETISTGDEAPVVAELYVPGRGVELPLRVAALLWDPPSSERLAELHSQGVEAALLVGPPPADSAFPDSMHVVSLERGEAKRLFGGPPKPGRVTSTVVSLAPERKEILVDVPNVLAVRPGAQRPEEIVIIGAHYDHIGTRERGMFCRPPQAQPEDPDPICNGADDNASGTAVVLEVARAIAAANASPARTIVFAHFAGEETGLHGSRALAEDPPKASPFEVGRVVAMINLDMVGRLSDAGLSIGGLGSSAGWLGIFESVDHRELPIVFERSITSRSDHANFYRKKVPVLFFFTGLHADYHRTSDESDKINRTGVTRIASLVLDVVLAAADGRDMAFAEPASTDEGLTSHLPGENPETSVREDGKP